MVVGGRRSILYSKNFGLPISNQWNGDSQFDYVRSMLAVRGVEDDKLLELQDYLVGGAPGHTTDDEPWELPNGRLFITHLATHKATAESVKVALAGWGLDGFVAHRVIHPARTGVGHHCGTEHLRCTGGPAA